MRFRIHTLLLAAIVAAASLAVCAQTPPAADPAKAGVDAKAAAEAKKEADVKKAEEKKKAAEKRKADAAKKKAKAAEKSLTQLPEPVTGTPAKGVKKPGSGPMVEKRTVTDKGSSPFTLTDKEGKTIPTAPDAYDVSSATPKKR
jgi:membrane protein involved in colicin uptake